MVMELVMEQIDFVLSVEKDGIERDIWRLIRHTWRSRGLRQSI